jgi:putative ABC transport system permease protein
MSAEGAGLANAQFGPSFCWRWLACALSCRHIMRATSLIRIMQLGVKSLLLHKMRSGLTMLGIIFGVCSVIAMLAIGEGASYEAQEAIKKLGSSNIILRSVKPAQDSKAASAGRSYVNEYGLTYSDVARLDGTIPGIKRVLPKRIIRDEVRFNNLVQQAQIIGTHPIYTEMAGVDILRGRFLTETDETHMNNVCVLTVSLAENLFPYQDPLEQEVKIGSEYFTVVGLARERAAADKRPQAGQMEGQPLDSNVYVPLATTKSRFGETIFKRSAGSFEAEKVQLHEVTLQFNAVEDVEVAVPMIRTLLKRFHQKTDYEVIVPLELLRQAEQTKRIFNIVLGSIAAISLVVGGIGIMNIMLATVTERTREIGIRRALGAKKKDIVTQFLVETVVLSVGGGLIGVVVGVLTPLLVSQLTDMKTIITPASVLISFGISGAVGVVFGIYPASRAAALDPIEALRHE